MPKKTTIVLVDDHAVVRAGVRRLLEQEPLFEVIGEAESGEKAYQIFGELKPDVMVMDLSMPGMGGLESIRRILMRYEKAKILVLSMHEDLSFANQALKLGAKGYLTKNTLADDLVKSIETVLELILSVDAIASISKPSANNLKISNSRADNSWTGS